MENKYKVKVLELISNLEIAKDDINTVVNAMCQVAKEIEESNNKLLKDTLTVLDSLNKKYKLLSTNIAMDSNNHDVFIKTINNSYSKEQVKELLKKQRESDSENAYYYDINGNKISCKDEVLENELISF